MSHTVINPLVEELYVTVQIDELAYIYEGDSVEDNISNRQIWTFIAGTLAAYYLIRHCSSAQVSDSALKCPCYACAMPEQSWIGVDMLAAGYMRDLAHASSLGSCKAFGWTP